nr:sugar-binding protein [Tessaracoccus coleopterorum]
MPDASYGPELNIGRRWEGAVCNPDGTDCGAGSTLRMSWNGDDLYVIAKVVDDKVSAAAPPERCFGHWLVDSVEVLLDPVGGSRDTSTTFKSGIMPYTTDPGNTAGNGVDGPAGAATRTTTRASRRGRSQRPSKTPPTRPGSRSPSR